MKRLLSNTSTLSLLLAVVAAALAGCAGTLSNTPPGENGPESGMAALQSALARLGPGADAEEAHRVAHTAVTYSRMLAEKYRVVPPAMFHNLLIQAGIRDRGLCYHWTEDLMQQLQSLGLSYFRLHWGVAYKGSDLREHNSVVITALDLPFDSGLVLDPWRNSGELYWVRVEDDSYPWRELPRDEW
jgi:uncharacterized protein YceK